MQSKSPSKGLAIIIQKLKHFRNWLNLPPKCPEHGRQHLFASRTWKDGKEEVSYKCMVGDPHWMSRDLKSEYEDYLSDNW